MAVGERLKELGILPWLDVWEIRPGDTLAAGAAEADQVDQVGGGLHRP